MAFRDLVEDAGLSDRQMQQCPLGTTWPCWGGWRRSRIIRSCRGVTSLPGTDAARVVVTAEGRVEIYTSAADAGQGHADTYRALHLPRRCRCRRERRVEGQVRGAVAMGLGEVLLVEHLPGGRTAPDGVAPPLPAAAGPDVPPVEIHHLESPSPSTALGSKGVGEAGTIGAFGAIANAVADARRIPYRIWPRISPPGKSPGPVFGGATPSSVCTLT
jgi:CO/xanthine dehydrogenase Mo-binding subunit